MAYPEQRVEKNEKYFQKAVGGHSGKRLSHSGWLGTFLLYNIIQMIIHFVPIIEEVCRGSGSGSGLSQ